MSRGETSSRKLTSSDAHPFFGGALIELNDGGVAFNPQFGLDYTGEEGTRIATARRRRRHRRPQNSHNPNEAIDADTTTSSRPSDASTETTQEAVDETHQQEGNDAVADNANQVTIVDEQEQDEGKDEDDLDGNLGDLKYVYPLASSLRATPAAFEAIRQKRRRPRLNSFSALGA